MWLEAALLLLVAVCFLRLELTASRLCSCVCVSLLLPQKENIGDLLIVNAQLSQAGMYTCTAQTVVDSAAASAKLVVRGEASL